MACGTSVESLRSENLSARRLLSVRVTNGKIRSRTLRIFCNAALPNCEPTSKSGAFSRAKTYTSCKRKMKWQQKPNRKRSLRIICERFSPARLQRIPSAYKRVGRRCLDRSTNRARGSFGRAGFLTLNDKIVLVGHDPAQAALTGAMKELIQRFSAKVFFEVFERHRVNLAFREFHRNI